MIIEVLIAYFANLLSYLSIILFLHFFGRAFLIILKKFNYISNDEIFGTKTYIFFPILGFFMLGNLLILLNFFIPVKSSFVIIVCLLILAFNFLEFNIKLNLNFLTAVHLLIIPSILIFSTYGTSFHYDAGYYHLGNQLWIRETNLPFGFVNIFWAYGIGSIYEYIAAFFWIDSSLQSLHFVNLVFVNIFFTFLFYHAFVLKESNYKYSTYFLIVFAFLDNFGFKGGRNGFLYAEGIGAFDNIVGVLFFFTIIFSLYSLSKRSINNFEFFIVSSFALLSLQLKLSSFILIFVLLRLIYLYKSKNNITFTNTLKLISINYFFFASWVIKNYISTGCLIFPANLTCINSFNWYRENSTSIYQNISISYSNPYTLDSVFADWFLSFLSVEINKTVLINFLASYFLLFVIKNLFFDSKKFSKEIKYYFWLLIVINLFYFLFFGPIPRYMIGFLLFIVGYLGFNITKFRYKLNLQYLMIFIFTIAVFAFPRLNSYRTFVNNTHLLVIGTPTLEIKNKTWTTPVPGEDQCWVVQYCTAEKSNNPLIVDGFIKTIYFDN